MASNMRRVRCFAEKRGQQWQAFCIELNLAVQADTLEEVQQKLHAVFLSYVQLAMEQNDPDHQRDMLYRPAPLSIRLRYWFMRTLLAIANCFKNHNGDADSRPDARRALTFHDQAGYC